MHHTFTWKPTTVKNPTKGQKKRNKLVTQFCNAKKRHHQGCSGDPPRQPGARAVGHQTLCNIHWSWAKFQEMANFPPGSLFSTPPPLGAGRGKIRRSIFISNHSSNFFTTIDRLCPITFSLVTPPQGPNGHPEKNQQIIKNSEGQILELHSGEFSNFGQLPPPVGLGRGRSKNRIKQCQICFIRAKFHKGTSRVILQWP